MKGRGRNGNKDEREGKDRKRGNEVRKKEIA